MSLEKAVRAIHHKEVVSIRKMRETSKGSRKRARKLEEYLNNEFKR